MPLFFVRPYYYTNYEQAGINPADSIRIVEADSEWDAEIKAAEIFGMYPIDMYVQNHPENEPLYENDDDNFHVSPDGMLRYENGQLVMNQLGPAGR